MLLAAPFLDRVQSFLEEDEAANNLSLGILSRPASEPYQGEESRPFFALVEHEGRVTFVMVRTPPYNLIVYGEGETSADASVDASTDAAISFLLAEQVSLPGVIGPRDVSTRFANEWSRKTECLVEMQMDQMIYRLDRVNKIEYPRGEMIRATQEHLDLVAEWTVGFSEATPETMDLSEALRRTERRIQAGRLHLWHHKVPVSMAWKSRTTSHGVVVSGVYTPPALRNRGYATACVASLSQRLLDEGHQFCALYADLSNPTSNSIYQKMGYRPVRASVAYRFLPSKDE